MQRIRQLSTILGRVPAFAYLAAYLILILLFSLIFYALPARHFQQPATSPELSPSETERSILRDLGQEIQRTYLWTGAAKQVGNGWRMRLDELDVPFMNTCLPGCFLIDLVIPIDHGSPGTNAVLQTALTVYTSDPYISNGMVYLRFLMQYNSASPVEGIRTQIPPPGVQFRNKLPVWTTPVASPDFLPNTGRQIMMPLSQALYDRIIAYGASIQTAPPADSRNYPRMLYFSTGVGMFGGPGEPVPATALAALLVFLEAVGAVLLIGLFVNSLAYELGEKLRGMTQTPGKPARMAAKPEKKRPTKRAAKTSNSAPRKRLR